MATLHDGMYKQQPGLEHGSGGHPGIGGDGQHTDSGVAPMTTSTSPVHIPLKDHARPSLLDMTEDERVRRRREINRNSQRRIRERRIKELEELRTEVGFTAVCWPARGLLIHLHYPQNLIVVCFITVDHTFAA